MDPVVTSVLGFEDELVEVGVMLKEVEPLVGNVHVGVSEVVVPIGVWGLRNLNVGCFAKCVL